MLSVMSSRGQVDCAGLYARGDRNLPLLSSVDLNVLARSRVGIVGCGVGAAVAQQLALAGVGTLILCDDDLVDESNLNRHPIATRKDLRRPKADVVGDWLVALGDVRVDVMPGRIESLAGAESFVASVRSGVLIEEVDDWATKLLLRKVARTAQVPVVSATDLGDDRVLVDVERFDLGASAPFHGLVDDDAEPDAAIQKLFGRYCSPEFAEALAARIDRRFPQLGSTMSVAGGLTSRIVRKILLERPGRPGSRSFESGRYLYDFESGVARV